MESLDYIFTVCAAIAMISLTIMVVAFCAVAVYGVISIMFDDE